MNEVERFWSHVDKTGSCWNWKAGTDYYGYGIFKIWGKSQRAHRISYKLAHGSIPAGMNILHSCNNPACVNPSHLRAGTQAENMQDRDNAGRHAHGTSWKIGTVRANEIRRKYADGAPVKELAKEYGILPHSVFRIISGRGYAPKG